MDLFYSAFSFIRITSAGATAELERQTAEYKRFRSLTLVFLLDIPFSMLSHSFSVTRLLADFLIVGLSVYRFRVLFHWPYQLAFGFYLHLQKDASPEKTDPLVLEVLHSAPSASG